jgi:hypothetical protein
MSEVKFTDDELKEVKDLQSNYLDVQNEFGQLKLAQIRLERQEQELSQKLTTVENSEKSFLDKITEKYGRGTLNPETGVFTPEKS